MTTCLRLPRVPFVNCCQFMYLVISLLDLIISVPDHCLSFTFHTCTNVKDIKIMCRLQEP